MDKLGRDACCEPTRTNSAARSLSNTPSSTPELPSHEYSLYVKGRVLGHKRGKRNSRPNTSLVQLEGVDSKEAAQFYLGKVSQDARLGQAGISGRGVEE